LLLYEQALSYMYADEEGNSVSGKRITILQDTHSDEVVMGTQADMLANVVQKLARNPSLVPSVRALYAGSYESVKEMEVDGRPIIDS